MTAVLLSDAEMVERLNARPLPSVPRCEGDANRAFAAGVSARLRDLLTPAPADPSSQFEALEWGPEGQPGGDYCGRFRDWTRERYEMRAKSEPVPTVLWDGKRITPAQIHAQARDAAAFSASLTSAAQPPKSELVSSSTSQKRRSDRSAIDPAVARVKRMRKSVLTTARLHASVPRSAGYRMSWVMVTLTLAEGVHLGPRDISVCIDHIRKWARRHWPEFTRRYGFRYVWTMELTKAGVPHYHVLLATPYNKGIPFPHESGWWPHGWSDCRFARRAVGYIAKYASKLVHQAGDPTVRFPKGFRITGSGGLDGGQRDGWQHREKRFWMAPHWARDAFMPFYSACRVFVPLLDLRRVVGGFVDRLTGAFEACPWAVVFDQGFVSITAKKVTSC